VRLLSNGSTTATASVAGGFFEVRNDQVLVVSPAAELPDEIDIDRAKQARQRAEKRLSSHEELIDKTRATAALMRALNRMKHADDPRL
ncbi:MAG: ATP synthase delta/epsilon chain alpha-helix domain-containing protein, partial [Planctomycetota bacterium]